MVNRFFFALLVSYTTLLLAQEPGKQSTDEVSKQELAKLQGEWVLTKTLDADKLVYIFKGNEYTSSKNGEQSNVKVTFTIDTATEPKSITRTTPKGEVSRGIYKIDGDTLLICSAISGHEKPTEFLQKPGDCTLLTLKRINN